MSLNTVRPWRNIYRRRSRQIRVGKVLVGGDAPISVQTMTNTPTSDPVATIDQIRRCEEAGADIIRVSCPDEDSTAAFAKIAKAARVPLVADIHFHYKRALEAADAGAACLRINPGNIGDAKRVAEVVKAAKDYGCSIRIGVNAGSLEKHLLDKYGEPTVHHDKAELLLQIQDCIKAKQASQRLAMLDNIMKGEKDWRRFVWLLQWQEKQERQKQAKAKQIAKEQKDREKAMEAAAKPNSISWACHTKGPPGMSGKGIQPLSQASQTAMTSTMPMTMPSIVLPSESSVLRCVGSRKSYENRAWSLATCPSTALA